MVQEIKGSSTKKNWTLNQEKFIRKSDEENLKEKYVQKDFSEQADKESDTTKTKNEFNILLTKDLELMFKDTPLTEDTTCGWGIFSSDFLQK